MPKTASIVALAAALIACLVAWWANVNQEQSLRRALAQREAQLSQRYLGLINRMIDRISESTSQSAAATIEEALERLGEVIEASRVRNAQPNLDVTNVGHLDAWPVATAGLGEPRFAMGQANDETAVGSSSRHAGSTRDAQSQIILTNPDIAPDEDSRQSLKLADGRIVFVSDDGDGEIYVINADGTGKMRLTRNDVHDLYPTWSPDGKYIAFVSDQSGKREVHLMSATGKYIEQVTDNDDLEGEMAWSGDGAGLAVSVTTPHGTRQVHIMSRDKAPIVIPNALMPSWSPDGKKLAFNRGSDIFLVNADGTEEQQLLPKVSDSERRFALLPKWSPDGDRVMFTAWNFDLKKDVDARSIPKFGIYTYDVSSKAIETLRDSEHNHNEVGLDWSPDGRHIVVYSDRNGRPELFVVNLSERGEYPVSRAAGFSRWASWRPTKE